MLTVKVTNASLPCTDSRSSSMKRTAAATFLLLIGAGSQALAAATPEEARRLTVLFQAYLGAEPGVVTVEPSGDSYRTRIDLAPHFAKIREPGVTVSLSPIEWTLTELGGGKWKVDQDQPLAFSFTAAGKAEIRGEIASVKGTGTFDEALGAFADTATDIGQVAYEQVMTENGQTSRVSYTIASMAVKSNMSGSAQSADGIATYRFTGLKETISTPAAGDGSMPPMDLVITVPDGMQQATVRGLKPGSLVGLLAWFVAHPSKDTIIAGQAELKDKLRAALPVFSSMSGTATLNGISMNTMIGQMGAATLEVAVDVNGVVADGMFREKFTFTGMQPPDGIVPPWAQGLVPRNFTIDFSVRDFDLAKPAGMILDALDLSKEPPLPPGMEDQLLAALLPKGVVTIGLDPSGVLAGIFDLQAQGAMTAGPAAMPAGQATIRLKGIDEIMAALQSAPPEMGMDQVAPVGIIAKGMAKQDSDGYLSWKIESTPAGSITINGTDISKIGGGP
jgi:hypothetical protein